MSNGPYHSDNEYSDPREPAFEEQIEVMEEEIHTDRPNRGRQNSMGSIWEGISKRKVGFAVLAVMFVFLGLLLSSRPEAPQSSTTVVSVTNASSTTPAPAPTPNAVSQKTPTPPLVTVAPPLPSTPMSMNGTVPTPNEQPKEMSQKGEEQKPVIAQTPLPENKVAENKTDSGEINLVAAAAVSPAPATTTAPSAPAISVTTKKKALSVDEQHLLKLKSEHYVLQILGAHSEKKLQAFVKKNGLQNKTHYYRTQHNGKPWFVLVYGDYANKGLAEQAIAHLPLEVKQSKPWARTVAVVQAAIRE